MKNNTSESVAERIIATLRCNRISTVEVADCMEKSGLFENAFPTQKGLYKVGMVKWVYAANNSNWSIHEQIRNVQGREVLMIEAYNCEKRAMIGALVSKYVLLYQQAEAIISNELFRDLNDIYKENYPIWCKGYTPIGCFNKEVENPPTEWIKEHHDKYQNSIAVCDDNGVVIIPKEYHTEDFLDKLEWIEEQEDKWFDCLDRSKMNTFEIVCLKKYSQQDK